MNIVKRIYKRYVLASVMMEYPPYNAATAKDVAMSGDRVRYASLALALTRIAQEQIPGSLAEVGVWKGFTSRFIHAHAPTLTLHLFDTFQGFPKTDLENPTRSDARFQDTSVEAVKSEIGNAHNVVFHIGYFPETARGLEAERFSLVVLDVDLYKPTVAALEFFYPRISPGGFVFVHDYNSPESDRAISRAVDAFLKDKPEQLIELPDRFGSVVFRKL